MPTGMLALKLAGGGGAASIPHGTRCENSAHVYALTVMGDASAPPASTGVSVTYWSRPAFWLTLLAAVHFSFHSGSVPAKNSVWL